MNLIRNCINRKIVLFTFIPILMLLFTGCNDATEIEDKKFAMSVGIDLAKEKLKVTYEFPSLEESTDKKEEEDGESKNNLFQAAVGGYYEAEKQFNKNSDKVLDYKHLKALIIGRELLENEEKLQEYILYIEKNSLYPWNTLVFAGDDTAEGLYVGSTKIDKSLGEYLDKMFANGKGSEKEEMVTLKDLMHHYYSKDKILLIPAITASKETGGNPVISEYKLMKNFQYVSDLGLEERELELVGNGKGKQIAFEIQVGKEFYVVEINKIKRKISIKEQKNIPVTYITLVGEAKLINKNVTSKIELDSIKEEFNHQLEVMVSRLIIEEKEKEGIDILNSFYVLGRKNRDLWLKYHDKQNQFEADLQYVIESELYIL